MSSPTSSLVSQTTQGPNGYFPSPYSTDPLPSDLRMLLLPIGIMSLVSVLSTLGLLCFIVFRMVFWRKYYHTYPGYNQFILLIFNLLLADLQQSTAFLMSFHWIAQNKILSPTAACFIQGWLIQVGDVSSGLWVLAIAIHTWYSVATGRKIEHVRFCCSIIGLWVFIILLTSIGPMAHPKDYFVGVGAWCWANDAYPSYRLGLCFFWMLLAQFGSVVVYGYTFFLLRRRIKQSLPVSGSTNSKSISRAARFMILYPIVYVAFSLPLPAGRLAVWSGRTVSLTYYCYTATLMTSCGFLDTILYAFTRRVLAAEISDSSISSGHGTNRRDRTITTVQGGVENSRAISLGKIGTRSKKNQELQSSDSTEDIWKIVKTKEFTVNRETSGQQLSLASSIEEAR